MRHTADPDTQTFYAMAEYAFENLPDAFRARLGNLVIQVLDYADRETLDQMGIADPMGLLGLYHGVDLTRQSTADFGRPPDMVFLYRKPIIAFARAEGVPLGAAINNVLVHEIGHHFGLSDAEMHALEDGPD